MLGPLLRYAGTESATFWVETSSAVRGRGARPPHADVHGRGPPLRAPSRRRPRAGLGDAVRGPARRRRSSGRRTTVGPRPVVHTRDDERHVRLVFGSCRVGDPQPATVDAPWPDELSRTGIDALWALREAAAARRGGVAGRAPPARRPGLRRRGLAGDARVHPQPPRHERAARRAGRRLRGVHAPLPRVVVGPRHSLAALDRADRDDLRRPRRQRRLEHLLALGRRRCAREPWWEARITGAFMAYWIYQHLGNLSPPELAEEEMLDARRSATTTPARALREFARHVRPRVGGEPLGLLPRLRRLAAPRLDSRAARVLADGPPRDGRRGGVELDRRPLARRRSTTS